MSNNYAGIDYSGAPLRKTRDKLMAAIMSLEARYVREYRGARLEYAQVDTINVLLNYLKALEYHYRDDVRSKKNKEYNAAMRLFRKITTRRIG
jgi:hypothetical protein